MKPVPISQQHAPPITHKKVRSIASPCKKLDEKAAEWADEIKFMEQERTFFAWLVFKSMNISGTEKRKELKRLHQQLLEFGEKQLVPFQDELATCRSLLKRNKNNKYPPVTSNTYEQYQALNETLKTLSADFKQLKNKVFSTVDKFLTVRIF